jgi:hypothetical protein
MRMQLGKMLDKPILRDLFWFIVLPYKFGLWLETEEGQKALRKYGKAQG